MMKKSLKKLGLIFTISASMILSVGCGKKDEKMIKEMVDKYSGYCQLGEYKGIEYQETKTVITDEDVQYQVNMLLDAYSTSSEVTKGVAKDGDIVNIDFVGKIDGEAFDGGSAEGWELELGSGSFIAGFEEQVMDHNVGETFDIEVTFPENYGEPSLAGKPAVFTVTINSLVEKVYPEYTDAFVAANTEYETIAAYEEYLLTAMTEDAAETDASANKTAVVSQVIDNATVNEYPQQEVEALVEDTVAKIEAEAISYGYELGDFVVTFYGYETVDAFKQEISDMVKTYMTEKVVMCAIAKAENITVTDEEIAKYKKDMMDSLAITDEEVFAETYSNEDVAYYALADKVVAFLLENNTPVQSTTETVE